VGGRPISLNVNPLTDRLYAVSDHATLAVVDARNRVVLDLLRLATQLPMGPMFLGIALNSASNRVYPPRL